MRMTDCEAEDMLKAMLLTATALLQDKTKHCANHLQPCHVVAGLVPCGNCWLVGTVCQFLCTSRLRTVRKLNQSSAQSMALCPHPSRHLRMTGFNLCGNDCKAGNVRHQDQAQQVDCVLLPLVCCSLGDTAGQHALDLLQPLDSPAGAGRKHQRISSQR